MVPIIDIVYTWVDNSDTDWLCEKKNDRLLEPLDTEFLLPNSTNNSKLNELLYSIRSLEKHIKFQYNKIYIVSNNGKLPNFLKNDSKIIFIKDTTLLGNTSYKSDAIESVLHLIPNLSEYFLYFNDDFLLVQDIYLNHYITENNQLLWYKETNPLWKVSHKITTFMSYVLIINDVSQEVSVRRINTYKKLNLTYDELDLPMSHSPRMFSKTLIIQFIHEYKNEIDDLRYKYKFRNPNDFLFCDGFLFWGIKNKHIIYTDNLKTLILINADITLIQLLNYTTFKAGVNKSHFLTISDASTDINNTTNNGNYLWIKNLLNELYPTKSIYEN